MEDDIFYMITQEYILCDLNLCQETENTIDFKLSDIANCRQILNLLNLVYLEDVDYEYRAKWFNSYLSAFKMISKDDIERVKYMDNKTATNPRVRLLLVNNELITQFKKLNIKMK